MIRGAGVAREDCPALEVADVLVEGGVITGVGSKLEAPAGAKIIGGEGRVLLPGLFDLHTHFRDPGDEDKETIRSGSEAAISGGFTGVLMMPNTSPAIDGGGVVQAVLDSARETSRIAIYTAGCITRGREGEELAGIAGMKAKGVRMLTDAGAPVSNPLVLRRAMEYARNYDLILASHGETPELSGDGSMNEGKRSYELGIPGIPSVSEEICVNRDCRLAQYTGSRLHIQQISTARAMGTVRRFKAEGVALTCEVTPHHLMFNEDDMIDYDSNYKVNPPLRTAEDNAALVQGLIDGVFDVIATGHAPHTEFEKKRDFSSAPFGVTGLETALPTMYERFLKTGRFGWDVIVKRLSAEPRRLIGLDPISVAEGQPAELALFNPERSSVFTRDFMCSKSSNTPFYKQEVEGLIELVVFGGEVLLER
ncbi:MAG: dihydroorotase [Verrucomicrobiales bacterium]|nr:dihydroorotase [Verrucomicrobiales bacterium]